MNCESGEVIKTQIVSLHGGAGRGTKQMLPHIASFNRASQRVQIAPIIADPIPGKALEMAERFLRGGVTAEPVEAKLEEVIQGDETGNCPVIVQVDQPESLRKILKLTIGRPNPVMGYLLIKTPDYGLYGLRMVLRGGEDDRKEEASIFFEKLSHLTVRGGSKQVFGESGRPEHVTSEPLYREWFGEHMKENIGKLTVGIEPESAPFELTPDGTKTSPMFIRDNRSGWADPFAMAQDLVENHLPGPLVRGEDFIIAELGPDGLRFHTTRLRKTDGKLAVRGVVGLDPGSIREAEEQERIRRAVEKARRQTERQTLSRKWPVWPTD